MQVPKEGARKREMLFTTPEHIISLVWGSVARIVATLILDEYWERLTRYREVRRGHLREGGGCGGGFSFFGWKEQLHQRHCQRP